MGLNFRVSYGSFLFVILLPIFFQYAVANSTHQNGLGTSKNPLEKNHQEAVSTLLDGLIQNTILARNSTNTFNSESQNSSLLSDNVLSLLLQMQNGSGFPGNWTGLGNQLSMNRTGRGDDYGGSSYSGWGGSYNNAGYGDGNYGGGNDGILFALLSGRRRDHGPPPQQQQSNDNSDFASTALLGLLGLALIGRMPT